MKLARRITAAIAAAALGLVMVGTAAPAQAKDTSWGPFSTTR
jgi:hypothetical protein